MFDEKGFPPDPDNVGWVLCWACFSNNPWHLVSLYKNESDALNTLQDYGEQYQVRYGSWRVGTDEFIAS